MIEINGWIILVEFVSFLVLLGVLTRFFFSPLLRFLEERRDEITRSFNLINEEKENSRRMMEEARNRLDDALIKGKTMIAEAVKEGEIKRDEIIEESKKEADTILTRARREIEREKDIAIMEIRKEVADIAIAAARRIIEDSLSEDRAHRLIEEFTDALKNERLLS